MTAEAEGEHEFRSHAVGARDENGVLVFLAHFEESAEATDGAENARNEGALGGGFDAFDEFVSGVDRHAGSCVGELGHCRTKSGKEGAAGISLRVKETLAAQGVEPVGGLNEESAESIREDAGSVFSRLFFSSVGSFLAPHDFRIRGKLSLS